MRTTDLHFLFICAQNEPRLFTTSHISVTFISVLRQIQLLYNIIGKSSVSFLRRGEEVATVSIALVGQDSQKCLPQITTMMKRRSSFPSSSLRRLLS